MAHQKLSPKASQWLKNNHKKLSGDRYFTYSRGAKKTLALLAELQAAGYVKLSPHPNNEIKVTLVKGKKLPDFSKPKKHAPGKKDYSIRTRDGVVLGWKLGTNGLWNALTRSQSRDFKTEGGARRWWLSKATASDRKQMEEAHRLSAAAKKKATKKGVYAKRGTGKKKVAKKVSTAKKEMTAGQLARAATRQEARAEMFLGEWFRFNESSTFRTEEDRKKLLAKMDAELKKTKEAIRCGEKGRYRIGEERQVKRALRDLKRAERDIIGYMGRLRGVNLMRGRPQSRIKNGKPVR